MRVGLFLDVDNVLTDEPVNMQLARMLGVEAELASLERDFLEYKISNDEFNRHFVPLFRAAGFCQAFIDEHFEDVRLRLGADGLLDRAAKPFLITSGPSYFVNGLAERHEIPPDHVLASQYVFDATPAGLLAACTEPVSPIRKADFVKSRTARFDVTVGLGDSPELDGAFLAHCSIRVLVEEYRLGYLSVRELEPVVSMIRDLDRVERPAAQRANGSGGNKPRVFIGSSVEGLAVAESIQDQLQHVALCSLWTQDVFELSLASLESLVSAANAFDYAVLVMTPDDATVKRDRSARSPRDNVLFELGLFMGALGRERTYMVHPRDRDLDIPSDLAGVATATYFPPDRPEDLAAALGPAVSRLKRAIQAPR